MLKRGRNKLLSAIVVVLGLALGAGTGAGAAPAGACPSDITIGNPNIADPWVFVEIGDPHLRPGGREQRRPPFLHRGRTAVRSSEAKRKHQ